MKNGKGKSPRFGYRAVADDLRGRIVSGSWGAGIRIPTKLELSREYSVSDATVQKALNVLRAEGFLLSRGCAGTWVATAPPHSSHFGLVFPDSISLSNFWAVIVAETQRQQEGSPFRFHTYEKCTFPFGPDHERLLDDLRSGRLAGIMTPAAMDQVMSRNLAECVARISFNVRDPYPGGHIIRFLPTAPGVLEYLRAKGRRKLALLTTFCQYGSGSGQTGEMVRMAREMGMEIPSRFIQPVSISEHYTGSHIMELMMSLAPGDRPDAVYIMDDHLVTQATLGLYKSGVETGPEAPLEVIAHANFPAPPGVHVPVTFHGYDVRELVSRTVAVLTGEVAGVEQEAELLCKPVFADELSYPLREQA